MLILKKILFFFGINETQEQKLFLYTLCCYVSFLFCILWLFTIGPKSGGDFNQNAQMNVTKMHLSANKVKQQSSKSSDTSGYDENISRVLDFSDITQKYKQGFESLEPITQNIIQSASNSNATGVGNSIAGLNSDGVDCTYVDSMGLKHQSKCIIFVDQFVRTIQNPATWHESAKDYRSDFFEDNQ